MSRELIARLDVPDHWVEVCEIAETKDVVEDLASCGVVDEKSVDDVSGGELVLRCRSWKFRRMAIFVVPVRHLSQHPHADLLRHSTSEGQSLCALHGEDSVLVVKINVHHA